MANRSCLEFFLEKKGVHILFRVCFFISSLISVSENPLPNTEVDNCSKSYLGSVGINPLDVEVPLEVDVEVEPEDASGSNVAVPVHVNVLVVTSVYTAVGNAPVGYTTVGNVEPEVLVELVELEVLPV